ncbi:MAG: alanine--tRNA ligase-related protein, partial [Candidatus Omnitrophota bacterium]
MKANEIRKKFLEFFKSKEHKVIPSDSLVPKEDPTLLFTSAGMNQFKEQFLGHNVTYKRAASSQKCLRTADLENVGKTAYHHTFFEMLGNFSFGDYFKKEAIFWGWEFMTAVLGIEKEKLWVSVYKDDDESYNVWRNEVKVPVKKIVKLGAKDNFWPSNAPKDGPNGPCGPCSEIFYDQGSAVGCKKKTCSPSCDCGRFVEVWNLVFTQFERKDNGSLDPLPTKNIDTGMGLERIASVMQGVKTNFETDLFEPIIKTIKESNGSLKASDYNAIADHLRAAVFAICDGVAPSNEERGYVIRKLIRRAYVRGRAKAPFLYN